LKVLVTGAAGFLGAHVVDAFCSRGHEVRALVRPATDCALPPGVEVVRADLRRALDPTLVAGVDAVVHLAAQVTGSDEARFAGTVVATEHLLDAMGKAGVRRLVLCSSYSVYDWSRVDGKIDEDAALEERMYARDGYAVAKLWQERVARRADVDLTVLRPGHIWARGSGPDGGLRAGPLQFVIAPSGPMPLTHVLNCADCFVAATESAAAIGEILNVVDDEEVRTWRYARDIRRPGTLLVPVPFRLALAFVQAVHAVARMLLGPRLRLPSVFVPLRFEARFKPVHTSPDARRRVLGWRPPVPYEEALRR
jgi:nucleoside-diphosphate-sugar epimerase